MASKSNYQAIRDISSCGDTEHKALENLNEAVTLFLEESDKRGTLNQILEEAGFFKNGDTLEGPEFIRTQKISLPISLLPVKEA